MELEAARPVLASFARYIRGGLVTWSVFSAECMLKASASLVQDGQMRLTL